MIKILREDGYPVTVCCETLGVSTSGFYQHQKQVIGVREQRDRQLRPLIQEVFHEHRRRYGARRIAFELTVRGEPCGPERVARLMRELDLKAIQPRSFKPKTTDSRHKLGYSSNLLLECAEPTQINQIWVADITYVPVIHYGFLYLAIIMDLCSRRVVGWALQDHMRELLVIEALEMAIEARDIATGLIHHSDRGGQYAGHAFRARLQDIGARQSMSGAGNCYDNNFMESCFGTIKSELEMAAYDNDLVARREIDQYIRYYDIRRRHSSLGYETPASFEQKLAAL